MTLSLFEETTCSVPRFAYEARTKLIFFTPYAFALDRAYGRKKGL
jgi:hypothetical protein